MQHELSTMCECECENHEINTFWCQFKIAIFICHWWYWSSRDGSSCVMRWQYFYIEFVLGCSWLDLQLVFFPILSILCGNSSFWCWDLTFRKLCKMRMYIVIVYLRLWFKCKKKIKQNLQLMFYNCAKNTWHRPEFIVNLFEMKKEKKIQQLFT